MNELTAKVSEPTALQNPTPTELALLKRLEDCAVVMRGMADMMRTTNERMGALEREVRMLTKVTPAQATAINTAIRGAGGGTVPFLSGDRLREAGCRCHPQGHPADDGRASRARAAAVSV